MPTTAKPRASLSRRQLAALVDHVCELANALTSRRSGIGPQWIAVSTIADKLAEHGVEVDEADLDAIIAIAVERCTLKVEGNPPHSVSPWQPPLGRKWGEP
jgi:hypothetical protein